MKIFSNLDAGDIAALPWICHSCVSYPLNQSALCLDELGYFQPIRFPDTFVDEAPPRLKVRKSQPTWSIWSAVIWVSFCHWWWLILFSTFLSYATRLWHHARMLYIMLQSGFVVQNDQSRRNVYHLWFWKHPLENLDSQIFSKLTLWSLSEIFRWISFQWRPGRLLQVTGYLLLFRMQGFIGN